MTSRDARAAFAPCTFTTAGTTMTLDAGCATTGPLVIPDGYTLDGAGHTITGGDPGGNHWKGVVVQNGGARASVTNLTVTVGGLAGVCDAGADRPRGILVIGGPGNGGDFCAGIQILQNQISENDVGVLVSQYEADFSAPARATNIKVVNNTISKAAVTSGYVYQAGVSDVGNNDKIITNKITGAGYNPTALPGSTFSVDADTSFTNRPKVHANKSEP